MAAAARIRQETGVDVETLWGDDGFVVWDVTPGTTYSIAVGTEAGPSGSFALSWDLPDPRPANDDFADATSMTGVSGQYAGRTSWATGSTRSAAGPRT